MQTNISPFFLLILFVSLICCKPNERTNKSIEGIWESVGYGKFLKIDASTYAYFDSSRLFCQASKKGDLSEIINSMEVSNDSLVVKVGLSAYYYSRAKSLPDICRQSTKVINDPVYNFEVFAEAYKNHYAYFQLNGIDWDDLYKTSKEKISPATTEVDLYLIMQEMLDSLNDNHGYIEPPEEVYELAEAQKGTDETAGQLKEYGDFEIADLVARHFLKEDLTKDSWLINWGKMENNMGYIQVKTMFLYADLNLSDSLVKENGFVSAYMHVFNGLNHERQIAAELAGIKNLMDRVMESLKKTKSIIIDVRFNGGGHDVVGLEVLRRFNSNRTKIAAKNARHNNGFTKKTPIYLEPAEDPYTKPVYLLTSQQSASATDMMALSSMELKQLRRIGSRTNGAISDALEKTLPNGWYFSVSNEIYTDLENKCYENIGVPVDFELNYPQDRQTFFRTVANDLEKDKQDILQAIDKLQHY